MSAIASNMESISSQRSMDVTMVLRTRYIIQVNIGVHIILAKIIHVAARWPFSNFSVKADRLSSIKRVSRLVSDLIISIVCFPVIRKTNGKIV